MQGHKCENCLYAKRSDSRTVTMRNGGLYISQNRGGLTCTAKVIMKMDMRGDEMYCSSFRSKEEADGL